VTATGPDPGCVVQVRDRTVSDRPSFGTGYLIGPGLVLTAAHVVPAAGDERPAAITVGAPGQEPAEGGVVWWRKEEQVDAALIRIPAADHAMPPRPPTRYGAFISSVASQPAEAIGFPRLQKYGSARDQEHFDGRVSPLTGAVSGRYELASGTPLPGPAPDEDKVSWAGISGAAVFSRGLLVGIVRSDRRARFGARLTATPMSGLLANQEFRDIVSEATGWDPVCEPVELSGLLESPYPDRETRSVASLLRPEVETVRFHGRATEIERLESWCAGPESLAMLIVTGPGGAGKSRLVRHFLAEQRARGWITGVLRPGADVNVAGEPRFGAVARTRQPLLIAVDYAENHLRDVRALIGQARAARGKVRLLLVARDRAALATALTDPDAGIRDLFADAPEQALPPLIATAQEWADAFSRAVQDLAMALPGVPGYEETDWPSVAARISPPDPTADGPGSARAALLRKLGDAFDPRISRQTGPDAPGHEEIDWSAVDLIRPPDPAVGRPGSVLAAHMAALSTLVEQASPLAAGRSEPAERTLLRHEEAYWTTVARRCGLRLDRTTLRSSVAALALVTIADEDQAIKLFDALTGGSAEQGQVGARWLRELYPRREGRYLGAVQPDRLAEFLLADACTETPGLLTRIVSAAADCGDPQEVARLEYEFGNDPALSYNQSNALSAAVLAARSQARSGNSAGPLIDQIERTASLPVISNETLKFTITNVVMASAPLTEDDIITNADGKSVLARDIDIVAPFDTALAALQVAGFRRGTHMFATGGPLEQGHVHAQHSMALSQMGRVEEALEESGHAMDCFRTAPGARLQLADHLHAHARLLQRLDRNGDAAEILCEEVELRDLADWPRYPLPSAFETLVAVLLRAGQQARARSYAERAIDVLSPSSPIPARDQAEAYLRALGSYADVLAADGAIAEALTSCSRAEAFLAGLPAASAGALAGDRAAINTRRAELLSRRGDHADGAATWLESAKHWQRLSEPYRGRDPVAQAVACLCNAAANHAAAGKPAMALAAIREAAGLANGDRGHVLRRDHPDVYEQMQVRYVVALIDAGQPEQAVSEAESRWSRVMPSEVPARQLLADTLGSALHSFAIAGRFADAVRAGRIAVPVIQALEMPGNDPKQAATSAITLTEYSGCLAKSGHPGEGAEAGALAASAWRCLCTANPQLRTHLANALTNQAECLRLDSRFADAAGVFAEAARTLRDATADSAAERLKLARLLERQAHCEAQVGHHDAAARAHAQAVELRRESRNAFPADDAELAEPLQPPARREGRAGPHRFEQDTHSDDPDEEVRALRTAVANAGDDADRGFHQALLAIALWRRSASRPADLDEAITTCRECLASWPPGHPKRSTVLFTLSAAVKDRFDRGGRPADLDDAVSAGREAINARQPGVPYSPAYGMALGAALWARYKRDHQRADLNELIEVMQKTVDAARPSHSDHRLAARNLALALAERASRTNLLRHVDQALQANRYLVEILPASDPQRTNAQQEVDNILRWRRHVHPDA
jgi:tetratricopeptide (TPR) repeat protein